MHETPPARHARELQAKATCAQCPVRGECLGYAMRVSEPLGIWGGLNETERHALVVDARMSSGNGSSNLTVGEVGGIRDA